jgi:integrase
MPPKIGDRETVASWLKHWLYNVSAPSVKPKTYLAYRNDVERHLIPALGQHRLVALTPEHVERMHVQLLAHGLSAKSVLNAHRTLSRALKMAMVRGKLQRNVATLTTPPPVIRQEIEPLTSDEARRVLTLTRSQRNGARWAIALGAGLRQGETLGLGWNEVDLDKGILHIRWQLQRLPYEHGCVRRGETATCGGKPLYCPRRRGGTVFSRPKSRAGSRDVVLPGPLVDELRMHRKAQLEERILAGSTWQEGPRGGLVFCQRNGKPIDARRDYADWLELLSSAGVSRHRVHDARHSTATFLLEAGVDIKVVAEILGHSQSWFTRDTYQHVSQRLQAEAAEQMAATLWGGS